METKEKKSICFRDFIESDLRELREATTEHLEQLVMDGLEDIKVVGFGKFTGEAFRKGYAAAMALDERYGQDNYVSLYNQRFNQIKNSE